MDAEQIRVFREKLRQLEKGIGSPFRTDEECAGLTLSQCHALLEIGEKKEISLVELSSLLGLDTSTISRTINRLVLAGLVNRFVNSIDRRYVSISLTTRGRELCEYIDNKFNAYFARVFELIPEFKHNFVLESVTLFTNALIKYNVKNLSGYAGEDGHH